MTRPTDRRALDWIEPVGWPDDARRDRLIGDWHIYQRAGGHRTSTDDLVTAWYAVHRSTEAPDRYLDLGCGVGSVLLMVAHRLRPKHAMGIEAQPQSIEMARRAVRELPNPDVNIRLRQADFRDVEFEDGPYDLVTASPPYFPLGAGVLPDDPQRRACRFEARGDVGSYLQAGARAMAPGARLYIVFQTRGAARVMSAAARHALQLTGQADFSMRTDSSSPFLTVFEFSRDPTGQQHRFECAVRDGDGSITPAYQQVRRGLGVA